ncbi:hypothetical protein GWI33_020913 [Rhynchophorus ferrugineus]|uniref:Uncharacterized protein n=1 Tax=Rhynchophorus ferrugineus TaxID=354439 RepID=A0A834M074_RHYFE|nr:hypothetical protein GWI33_020913 [Rhynchophorus ferrugineus]
MEVKSSLEETLEGNNRHNQISNSAASAKLNGLTTSLDPERVCGRPASRRQGQKGQNKWGPLDCGGGIMTSVAIEYSRPQKQTTPDRSSLAMDLYPSTSNARSNGVRQKTNRKAWGEILLDKKRAVNKILTN